MAYEVAMETARCTQACFHAAGTHAVLHPQGECWESEVEGQGWRGHNPGINSIKSTALTVHAGENEATNTNRKSLRLLETSNIKIEKMF